MALLNLSGPPSTQTNQYLLHFWSFITCRKTRNSLASRTQHKNTTKFRAGRQSQTGHRCCRRRLQSMNRNSLRGLGLGGGALRQNGCMDGERTLQSPARIYSLR